MSVCYLVILLIFGSISSHSNTTLTSTPLTLNFTLGPKSLVSYVEALPQMQIDYSSQTPTTTICFGAFKQCFSVQLALSMYETWVVDITNPDRKVTNRFDEAKSNTCKVLEKKEIIFDNGNRIKGKALEDKMWIGGQEIEKIRFFSASNSEEFAGIDGMFGLGYSPNREEEYYAIRTQLLNSRMIKDTAFEVSFTDDKKGTLSLGYVSNEVIDDYTHYGNCPIIVPSLKKKSPHWECNLFSMGIGKLQIPDSEIRFNQNVVRFDLSTDKTLFPISYLLQLEKNYFQRALENGDCNFGIKNGYYTYTCLENNLSEFREFSLVFNEWAIHIPMEHLFVFDPVDSEYEFVIYNKDGYNGFVIGTNIMKHYKMVFDEENQIVGFYNRDPRFVVRISDEPIRPPSIPKEDQNKPLQPLPGDKENPYNPPFNKEDNDQSKDKPIPLPSPSRGFVAKFFMSLGIMTLIFSILFVTWLAFRYYRRKKYNEPSFYYKATEDLFDEGTRIE